MANSLTPCEMKNYKAENHALSPIWVSSSITRKRQATGFEPLCHKSLSFSFLVNLYRAF